MPLTNQALIADISAHTPAPGTLSFWWLGQHSVILKLASQTLYLDPYLSTDAARQVPPLLEPTEVTNADLVFCSHDHGDHLDPFAVQGIAQASPQARFVIPRPSRERMLALGVPEERLIPLDHLEVADLDGLRITAIKAAHEFLDPVPGVGHPYLGFVIEADGCAVYHSGDTLCYEGLLTTLQRWQLSVAFLPINGRDAVRYTSGCIGNMTYQEAVDLAGNLKPRLVVPTHYDMFASNAQDPQAFVDYLKAKFPGQQHWVGEVGERADIL